ncbi:hypothetical protein [uncultured Desulfobacter sp.]|uniref:hypothetical protein n=1 Tax=uncultured Desulfobacter sp. TaxID=240139 RepID=UPI0029F5CBB0|nr:hypothetical protein [uncultured Desulfobacter sp.]
MQTKDTKKDIKQVKQTNPRNLGSPQFKNKFSMLCKASPILSPPQRTQDMRFAFMDFTSEAVLKELLVEYEDKLRFAEANVRDVLEEITNILSKRELKGHDVEYPDKLNLHSWRGIRSNRLDIALAERSTVSDELAQLYRDIARAQQAALEVTKIKKAPRRIIGHVVTKAGVITEVDGMEVVIKNKKAYIADDEYEKYAGMSLKVYRQKVVIPHRKAMDQKVREANKKLADNIANGHCPAL